MKKICFMALAVLLMCSAIYAQGSQSAFNAVGTVSTESRFSAGMYGSDVDDFIHPNFFDPEIGTFLFLGGFPGVEGDPSETDTGAIISDKYQISFGFGKTLGSGYLGLYYNGSLLEGNSNEQHTTKEKDMTYYNKVALLYGLPSMAFRLDLLADPYNTYSKTIKDTREEKVTSGLTAALTYGVSLGEIPLWARIGYRFADKDYLKRLGVVIAQDTLNVTKETKENSLLGFELGAELPLSENSSWVTEMYYHIHGKTITTETNQKDYERDGGFMLAWYNQYLKEYTIADGVTFKIGPDFLYKFDSASNTVKIDTLTFEPPSDKTNQFASSFTLGVKYTYDKVSLYSGIGLQLFNIVGTSKVINLITTPNDNHSYRSRREWEYEGILWQDPSENGNIAFGITYEPVENLVFGSGLKVGVPTVNLKNMTIYSEAPPNNDGTYNGNRFANTELQVTASYKF